MLLIAAFEDFAVVGFAFLLPLSTQEVVLGGRVKLEAQLPAADHIVAAPCRVICHDITAAVVGGVVAGLLSDSDAAAAAAAAAGQDASTTALSTASSSSSSAERQELLQELHDSLEQMIADRSERMQAAYRQLNLPVPDLSIDGGSSDGSSGSAKRQLTGR